MSPRSRTRTAHGKCPTKEATSARVERRRQELFYLAADGEITAVPVKRRGAFQLGSAACALPG